MTNRDIWQQRVEEWRASGLTSHQYCEGKPFTPGGLRHWAYRLEKEAGFKKGRVGVRMARVVRTSQAKTPGRSEAPDQRLASSPPAGGSLTLRVGRVCIEVRPDFDRGSLSTVLDLLGAKEASA